MQVVTLENLSNSVTVNEVQKVTVSSDCSSHLCGNTFFSLGYGAAMTGNVFICSFIYCKKRNKKNCQALHLLSGIHGLFFLALVASKQQPETVCHCTCENIRLWVLSFLPSGMIPVTASADVVEAALNSLWSIKPDSVQVTKQEDNKGSHFTVKFNSDRGKEMLLYEYQVN